jgi:hypothetical protein
MYYKKNSHIFVYCPDFFILLTEDKFFFFNKYIHKIIIVDTNSKNKKNFQLKIIN